MTQELDTPQIEQEEHGHKHGRHKCNHGIIQRITGKIPRWLMLCHQIGMFLTIAAVSIIFVWGMAMTVVTGSFDPIVWVKAFVPLFGGI